MQRKILRFIFLLSVSVFIEAGTFANAQRGQKVELAADVDGNGIPDRIVSIKYKKLTRLHASGDATRSELRNGHFVKYVLYRDSKKTGSTIFDYFIGDDESQYWVYKIEKVEDVNRDGLKDLIFYAGDDATHEYVFLLQKPSHFKAVYTSVMKVDEHIFDEAKKEILKGGFDGKAQVIARWNPRREVFESMAVKWIKGNLVDLREKPNRDSKLIRLLSMGDIVEITRGEANKKHDEWQKVEIFDAEGYVNLRHLSASSPTKQFKLDN